MSGLEIKNEVLVWAIERAGFTPSDLEIKFPKIHEWIIGVKQPTLKQLIKFAKITRTPFGFLFLKKPPTEKLPIPFYRTNNNEQQEIVQNVSPELRDTIYLMQRRQLWMKEYLVDSGADPLPYVHSVKLDETPEMVAQKIRETLGLDEDWASKLPNWEHALQLLRDAIENIGVLVTLNGIVGNNTRRKLSTNEFRGFVLVDEHAPLLFVNNADFKAAKIFTLIHELAHIFIGKSAAFDLREMLPANNKLELFCNQAAADFLVPKNQLFDCWAVAKKTHEPFHYLAGKFKVSVLVIARRALDLNLVDKSSFIEFYYQYQNDERRMKSNKAGGGDFYKNQNLRVGRRFATAVMQAAKEGKVSYHEAFRLTGLYGKTFDKYTASVEQGGL
jgi:Zn-dependent peptidase ImmA (M78 family)